jgi:hypothetical protein
METGSAITNRHHQYHGCRPIRPLTISSDLSANPSKGNLPLDDGAHKRSRSFTRSDAWQLVPRGNTGKAEWPCQGYTIRRLVTVQDDHLDIVDTLANATDRLLGVLYENELALAEKPIEIRLAGRPPYQETQIEHGGPHPTAMARWSDIVVGFVAGDDVSRSHALTFVRPGAIGLADHELGLAPGTSQTIEWSVFPLPGGDYWDFINAIRRSWNANFPIPGPHVFVDWSFGTKSDDYYRQWVRSRGLKLVTSPDAMFDQGKAAMGTAIPMAKRFCTQAAVWISQLHAAAPDVKALVYMNCSLSTEPEAANKYADSKLMDAGGNQLTMAAGSPQGVTMAPLFVSTPDSSDSSQAG